MSEQDVLQEAIGRVLNHAIDAETRVTVRASVQVSDLRAVVDAHARAEQRVTELERALRTLADGAAPALVKQYEDEGESGNYVAIVSVQEFARATLEGTQDE